MGVVTIEISFEWDSAWERERPYHYDTAQTLK